MLVELLEEVSREILKGEYFLNNCIMMKLLEE